MIKLRISFSTPLVFFLLLTLLVASSCAVRNPASPQGNNPLINGGGPASKPELVYEPISTDNVDKLAKVGQIDQTDWINWMAITSSNEVLVVSDRSIFKYSLNAHGVSVETIMRYDGINGINYASFSYDASLIALAVDEGIDIFSVSQAKVIDRVEATHPSFVALSRDNSQLAYTSIADDSNRLSIMDMKSREISLLPPNTGRIFWNPKKDLFATCSSDSQMILYDSNLTTPIVSKQYKEGCNVEWSHSGDRLAIWVRLENSFDIYDLNTNTFSTVQLLKPADQHMKWSNDDQILASLWSNGGYANLQLFKTSDWSLIINKRFGEVVPEYYWNFVWSNDDRDSVIFTQINYYVGLVSYNYVEDKLTKIVDLPVNAGGVEDFYISKDSQELYTTNGLVTRTWDITGQTMKSVDYIYKLGSIIGFNNETSQIAYKVENDNLQKGVGFYYLKKNGTDQEPLFPFYTNEVLWINNNMYLGRTYNNGLGLWNMNSISPIVQQPITAETDITRKSDIISPDHQYVAVIDKTRVEIYDTSSLKLVSTISGHSGDINGVAWNNSSDQLVTSSIDRTVRIWIMNGDQQVVGGDLGSVMYSIAWSPDGKTISCLSQEGDLYLLDAKDLKALKVFPYSINTYGMDESFALSQIKYTPDGKFIFVQGEGDLVIYGIYSGD